MSCPLPSHSDHESNFLKFLGEINDNNGSSQQESENFLIGKKNKGLFHDDEERGHMKCVFQKNIIIFRQIEVDIS